MSAAPAFTMIAFISPMAIPGGHDMPYNAAMANAVTALGWRFVTAVPESWARRSLPPFAMAVLNDRPSRLPTARLRHALSLAAFLRRQLRDAAPGRIGVFVDWHDLGSILGLIMAMPILRRRRAGLWLMLRRMPPEGGGLERRFRRFFRFLALALGDRARLVTDSTMVARRAAESWGLRDALVLPIPHIDRVGPSAGPVRDRRARLWWPGRPRPEKGLEIIRSIAQMTDGAELVELLIPEGVLEPPPAVPMLATPIPIDLDRGKFVETLDLCDLMLLPYSADAYRDGTSGLFVEAVCAGRLPVTVSGTWMADQLAAIGVPELAWAEDVWRAPGVLRRLAGLAGDAELWARFDRGRSRFVEGYGEKAFSRVLALHQSEQRVAPE